MSYSVDTSALLDAWLRYYPPDVFPTTWQQFDGLARQQRLLAVDEVKRELGKKEDGLHSWINDRPFMLIALDENIQQQARRIINQFPTLTNTNSRMSGSADPFVIALAVEKRLTVVTAEKSRPTKPRIPDACKQLSVPCITVLEMFRREGWKY